MNAQQKQFTDLAKRMVAVEKPTKELEKSVFDDYYKQFESVLTDKDYKSETKRKVRKRNLVELCTELAEIPTEFDADQSKEESSFEEDEVFYYHDKYQDLFNDYYDMFWGMLEERGYIHEND